MSTRKDLRAMQSAISSLSALLTPRATTHVCSIGARPVQRGDFLGETVAPLGAEFSQHGTNPQWIADQLRKMEGQ